MSKPSPATSPPALPCGSSGRFASARARTARALAGASIPPREPATDRRPHRGPRRRLGCLLVALTLTACGGAPPWMPLSAATPDRDDPDDGLTLVWIGHGACERLERGAWVRCPTLDYAFTVEQRRRGARWESVKTLRRHHPAYDGSAGPRIQTYFFVVDYAAPDADGRVAARVRSSLGDGTGATDREFRAATLALRAPVSRFAPFDRYRITQAYRYEEGRLEELVELDDGDRPWVRNREVARLFGARTFDAPPTRR